MNVEGTRNVIDEAVAAKAERFVYLGSTAVYGETKGEIGEKSHVAPENDYEKSKLEAEKIVLERQEEISVSVVRSGTTSMPSGERRMCGHGESETWPPR